MKVLSQTTYKGCLIKIIYWGETLNANIIVHNGIRTIGWMQKKTEQELIKMSKKLIDNQN